MSMFDVIKYPISDPPTLAELENVPEEIIWRWARKRDWNATLSTIRGYYAKGPEGFFMEEDRREIADLRKIIRRLP